MANASGVTFARRYLTPEIVTDRLVLEVGSLTMDLGRGKTPLDEAALSNPDGSIRGAVKALSPREYVGIDLEPGPGVDRICAVEDLQREFGPGAFDLVIASELIEHLEDWRLGLWEMAAMLGPGGRMLITTRSWGYPFHRAPWDYWRYEIDDAERIFPGAIIAADPVKPGILVLARGVASDLESVHLRSILTGSRTANARRIDSLTFMLTRPRLAASAVTPDWAKRIVRPYLPPPGY